MYIAIRIKLVRLAMLPMVFVILVGTNSCKAAGSFETKGLSQHTRTVNASSRQSPQRRTGRGRRIQGVYKDRIRPNWFAENNFFWYRNDLSENTKEFILVDVEQGVRRTAFDHEKLADALFEADGGRYRAGQLPFDDVEFLDNNEKVRFTIGEVTWICDLVSYTCSRADTVEYQPSVDREEQRPRSGRQRGPGRLDRSVDSPDGKWNAFIEDNNLFIRSKDNNEDIQLSDDGDEGQSYGLISWAPDSINLVAFRIEQGDNKEVYLIESSPKGGGRAKLHTRPYALPGDKFATYELNLFNINTRKQIKPQVDKLELGWGFPRLRWKKDRRFFTYEKVDRGHQRFRLIEIDSYTGEVRNLIDEKTDTFIWTAHTENLKLQRVNWMEKTDEVIYVSERDGWRHLYLIDAALGTVSHQITKGQWVVRGIDLIDEDARRIWFHACGKNPDQDPYFIHYYRVDFDGTGLVALTEGNGNHSIQYSPDRKYIIDTYSRVDMAPVHELRRVSDGSLVCELEKADITELVADGWKVPEVFVAKGRDGETDIWGIICRPSDFDPNQKYPVIEYIYAGPQGSFVPKSFRPNNRRFSSLADLGFIVVQMDGMGTANRSKAFHDVCWKNLKDAGFPDRILWHQAVAKKYPYYDISRVGIYGNSAGGQNAAGAVLFHPEFYKAAVASCGCHDNRMDKASWNEQWMGYPVGPQYSECSNIDNAYRLRGKLFLIVGEMDRNVPPESTMRLVDALIKAEKDFDLLVIPGGGHGMGGSYGQRRMQDFFVRHLLGVAPPDRNAPVQ